MYCSNRDSLFLLSTCSVCKIRSTGADPCALDRADEAARSSTSRRSISRAPSLSGPPERPRKSQNWHKYRSFKGIPVPWWMSSLQWVAAERDISPPELLACLRRVESRGALDTAHRVLRNRGQIFRGNEPFGPRSRGRSARNVTAVERRAPRQWRIPGERMKARVGTLIPSLLSTDD